MPWLLEVLPHFVNYVSDTWSNECQTLEGTNQGVILRLEGCKSSIVSETLIDVSVALVEQSSICAL